MESTRRTNRTFHLRTSVGALKATGTWRNQWTWCLKTKRKRRRVRYRRTGTFAGTRKTGRWGWKKSTRSSCRTRRISRRDRRTGKWIGTRIITARTDDEFFDRWWWWCVFVPTLGLHRFLTKMMRDDGKLAYACLFILLHVHTTMSIY